MSKKPATPFDLPHHGGSQNYLTSQTGGYDAPIGDFSRTTQPSAQPTNMTAPARPPRPSGPLPPLSQIAGLSLPGPSTMLPAITNTEEGKEGGQQKRCERRTSPSEADWARFRPFITHLYIDLKWKLKDIMPAMGSDYGFEATQKMYKSHFKRWPEARKNNSHQDRQGIRPARRRALKGAAPRFQARGNTPISLGSSSTHSSPAVRRRYASLIRSPLPKLPRIEVPGSPISQPRDDDEMEDIDEEYTRPSDLAPFSAVEAYAHADHAPFSASDMCYPRVPRPSIGSPSDRFLPAPVLEPRWSPREPHAQDRQSPSTRRELPGPSLVTVHFPSGPPATPEKCLDIMQEYVDLMFEYKEGFWTPSPDPDEIDAETFNLERLYLTVWQWMATPTNPQAIEAVAVQYKARVEKADPRLLLFHLAGAANMVRSGTEPAIVAAVLFGSADKCERVYKSGRHPLVRLLQALGRMPRRDISLWHARLLQVYMNMLECRQAPGSALVAKLKSMRSMNYMVGDVGGGGAYEGGGGRVDIALQLQERLRALHATGEIGGIQEYGPAFRPTTMLEPGPASSTQQPLTTTTMHTTTTTTTVVHTTPTPTPGPEHRNFMFPAPSTRTYGPQIPHSSTAATHKRSGTKATRRPKCSRLPTFYPPTPMNVYTDCSPYLQTSPNNSSPPNPHIYTDCTPYLSTKPSNTTSPTARYTPGPSKTTSFYPPTPANQHVYTDCTPYLSNRKPSPIEPTFPRTNTTTRPSTGKNKKSFNDSGGGSWDRASGEHSGNLGQQPLVIQLRLYLADHQFQLGHTAEACTLMLQALKGILRVDPSTCRSSSSSFPNNNNISTNSCNSDGTRHAARAPYSSPPAAGSDDSSSYLSPRSSRTSSTSTSSTSTSASCTMSAATAAAIAATPALGPGTSDPNQAARACLLLAEMARAQNSPACIEPVLSGLISHCRALADAFGLDSIVATTAAHLVRIMEMHFRHLGFKEDARVLRVRLREAFGREKVPGWRMGWDGEAVLGWC